MFTGRVRPVRFGPAGTDGFIIVDNSLLGQLQKLSASYDEARAKQSKKAIELKQTKKNKPNRNPPLRWSTTHLGPTALFLLMGRQLDAQFFSFIQ